MAKKGTIFVCYNLRKTKKVWWCTWLYHFVLFWSLLMYFLPPLWYHFPLRIHCCLLCIPCLTCLLYWSLHCWIHHHQWDPSHGYQTHNYDSCHSLFIDIHALSASILPIEQWFFLVVLTPQVYLIVIRLTQVFAKFGYIVNLGVSSLHGPINVTIILGIIKNSFPNPSFSAQYMHKYYVQNTTFFLDDVFVVFETPCSRSWYLWMDDSCFPLLCHILTGLKSCQATVFGVTDG